MLIKKKKPKGSPEINASSMADIAFLLLIFFLVTAVIVEDKGILVKLPEWSDEEVDLKIASRNVYSVLVNAQNQLLVRGQPMDIHMLRENTMEFIANPTQRSDYAEKPTKAVISLKNDRGTKYHTYLAVYNELQAAYNDLWDDSAKKKFGKPYEKLSNVQKREVRSEIPLVISEAEPTAYGEE